MKHFLKYSSFLLLLGGLATQLPAANITINNPSFEADVLSCAPGCSTDDSLTDWTGTVNSATHFGAYKPGTNSYPGGVPNGVNVAFLLEDGPSVSISQTLSATVQANDTYTLSLDAGLRNDTNVYNPGLGCYGASAALEAGGTILASYTTCPAVTGTFIPWTVTYSSGSNPAELGAPLEIVLTAIGSGSPYEPAEIDFDNLSLSDTLGSGPPNAAAPEPASFVLLGTGLAGLLFARRSRKA